jgi:hypothetical protein
VIRSRILLSSFSGDLRLRTILVAHVASRKFLFVSLTFLMPFRTLKCTVSGETSCEPLRLMDGEALLFRVGPALTIMR